MRSSVTLTDIRRRYIYLGTSALDKDECGQCFVCAAVISPGEDHVYHSSASFTVPSDRLWIGICSSCHASVALRHAAYEDSEHRAGASTTSR